MFRLALTLSFVLAVAFSQRAERYNGDPQIAAILQEQRYLSGDGTFGAAYQQEDGIAFKEESDADGNRKGSYSYVDPTGQRRTITYTAGKNGFQATGDHIPVAPAALAPVASQPQLKPDPQYNSPQPHYDQPQQQYRAPTAAPAARNYNPEEDDGQYHPELYENENYISPAAVPVRQAQAYVTPVPAAQARKKPAYVAPAAPSNTYQGVQQAQYSGVQQPAYSAPAPASSAYSNPTTQPPHRFFPPGQFSLNRSPDGYSYSFSNN